MFVILAIDALEYDLVHRFGCTNLMQQFCGKTDISEFSEPRTMVLWSSFLTGRNQEEYVLSFGDKEMWNLRFDPEKTFLSGFKSSHVIDLPGLNYDNHQHEKERSLLRQYFEESEPDQKEKVRKRFNALAFAHHRVIKEQFEDALNQDYDLVIGYFSVADVIGHLNFTNSFLMRMIYRDLDDIAKKIPVPKLILSDHGMKPIGIFGDHSNYGFWSSDSLSLDNPKITDFFHLMNEFVPMPERTGNL